MQSLKLGGDYIVHGENAISYLETLKGKKAFIVTSGKIAGQLGQLDIVKTCLTKAGMETCCFDDVDPDPEIKSVLAGAAAMGGFQPDWIIAIGGGSAMDAAKAMWVAYENPEFDTLEKFMPPHIIPKMGLKAKLVCIPTTSGTGSEVTRSVVLSDKAMNLKLPFRSDELIPDIAILEASFTSSMPPSLTAFTGMDALTHAVESYVSRNANNFSDAFAEKSMLGIFKYLPLAFSNPANLYYRGEMHCFSTMAGLAFANVGLGIVHSIAHAFGGIFHVPHGLANAVLLPYVIDFNRESPAAAEKYQYLEKLLGRELRTAIEDLKTQVRVPVTMQEVIRNDREFEDQLSSLIAKALADGCTGTNPISVNGQQMETLIRDAYFGMQR